MKSLVLTALLSSLMSSEIEQGKQPTLMPEKCPSVASIASDKINYVAPFPTPMNGAEFWWIGVIENSYFDTEDNWTIVMLMTTKERNGRKIMENIANAVQHLKPFRSDMPQWDEQLGAICTYRSKQDNLVAVAIAPSLYQETTINS